MNRFYAIKKASIIGIISNIFLCIIKSIIGFITNSQAMIADAVNSAGDIFSSIMAFIGNKIASKPKDEDHNLGHGKAEYIFSMLISISMILVGTKLFLNSTFTIISTVYYKFSYWLIIISIITIITKFILYLYTHGTAKKYNSILLEANAKDHKNDCIITTFTLISSLFSYNQIYIFDTVVGIGISSWVILVGFNIFIDSYNVLMDKAINNEGKKKVLDIIKKYPEIKKNREF